jgi:hypothetical protein
MGDHWDYIVKKLDIAWQLAQHVMQDKPQISGKWTEDRYLFRAQEVMQQAFTVVNTVFAIDEKNTTSSKEQPEKQATAALDKKKKKTS